TLLGAPPGDLVRPGGKRRRTGRERHRRGGAAERDRGGETPPTRAHPRAPRGHSNDSSTESAWVRTSKAVAAPRVEVCACWLVQALTTTFRSLLEATSMSASTGLPSTAS